MKEFYNDFQILTPTVMEKIAKEYYSAANKCNIVQNNFLNSSDQNSNNDLIYTNINQSSNQTNQLQNSSTTNNTQINTNNTQQPNNNQQNFSNTNNPVLDNNLNVDNNDYKNINNNNSNKTFGNSNNNKIFKELLTNIKTELENIKTLKRFKQNTYLNNLYLQALNLLNIKHSKQNNYFLLYKNIKNSLQLLILDSIKIIKELYINKIYNLELFNLATNIINFICLN